MYHSYIHNWTVSLRVNFSFLYLFHSVSLFIIQSLVQSSSVFTCFCLYLYLYVTICLSFSYPLYLVFNCCFSIDSYMSYYVYSYSLTLFHSRVRYALQLLFNFILSLLILTSLSNSISTSVISNIYFLLIFFNIFLNYRINLYLTPFFINFFNKKSLWDFAIILRNIF